MTELCITKIQPRIQTKLFQYLVPLFLQFLVDKSWNLLPTIPATDVVQSCELLQCENQLSVFAAWYSAEMSYVCAAHVNIFHMLCDYVGYFDVAIVLHNCYCST
jgi:hypothetical protein